MMCQTGLPISCLIFPQCDLHKGRFFWFGNRSFASLCFWNGPHVDSSKVYKSCLNERRATASNFQRNIYHRLRAASTFSPQIVFHLHHSRTLCVKTQILPFPKTWTMTRTTRGGDYENIDDDVDEGERRTRQEVEGLSGVTRSIRLCGRHKVAHHYLHIGPHHAIFT